MRLSGNEPISYSISVPFLLGRNSRTRSDDYQCRLINHAHVEHVRNGKSDLFARSDFRSFSTSEGYLLPRKDAR